ncbi:MAG: hypothetical protein JW784_00370, partial [Candidatus Cloacimonetes bacterium]|nr:hypothetical protein [Candidatus Cloacimonadota bacterium]
MKYYTTIMFLLMIFSLTCMEYTVCSESGDFVPSWVTNDLNYQLASEGNKYQREVGEWSGAGPWGGNVRSLTVDGSAEERMAVGCGFSMLSTAGGVWYSEDSGAHWQASSLQGKPVYAVCNSPSEPGVMWAGARNGLYKSNDYGEMWTLMGFNTTFVIAAGVHQSNGEVVVAGLASNSGIRVTQNGGETWETVGLNSGYMKGFASTPADTSLMVIAVSGLASSVYSSSNLGSSWEGMGLAGDAYDVEISDSDADLIFVAHDNGVYRTTNGGADWQLVLNAGTVRSLVVRGSEIYATINGVGVYESADNGEEWTLNSNGIVETNWATGTGSQEGVYFGFWGGIYHSPGLDSVYNLYQEGLNAASVHAVAYYADRGELWAVTEGSGIYLSNDLGTTWEHRSSGLTSWTVYNMAPNDHDFYQVERMMAATYDGVFASDDHGNSWYQIA